jgi:hypothetical protein
VYKYIFEKNHFVSFFVHIRIWETMFQFLSTEVQQKTMLHDWEYHDPHTGMKDQSIINHILIKSQKLSMKDIPQVAMT